MRRETDGRARKPVERRRVSASSRAVPMLMAFLGLAIVVATQAAERGLLTGVTLGPMAYVFGAVLIVLGVMGVGRSDPVEPEADEGDGPIRESGRDADEADEEARLRETLREIDRIRRLPSHER